MRIVVLTTSYPRHPGDVAGTFVEDAVVALRAEGVDVDVVSPADFRHYGIAYGDGIVGNLRRRPWLLAAVPLFLVSFARAARRAAQTADLVHAHWLPSALPALATRRPFVLQVWGTDVELARRVPRVARRLIRRARFVIAGSSALAAAAAELGAGDVRLIPAGVPVPPEPGAPADPPHVLFAGRLSEEKGIIEFLAASAGLPRVVVGDGPLRELVPASTGFVAHGEMTGIYERAAVVCVPSRREGVGFVAREAAAHARPVVATRVGGLPDAVQDGVTGLLVEPGDIAGLRAAIETLLADRALRTRFGDAGRALAVERFTPRAATLATIDAYRDALAG